MIPTDPGAEHRDTERCDREPWPFSWTVPVETPQSRYQREWAGGQLRGMTERQAVEADR